MTVPATIRELEKIEFIRQTDESYSLSHAVNKTQKEILVSFDMTERGIREQVIDLNKEQKRKNDCKKV